MTNSKGGKLYEVQSHASSVGELFQHSDYMIPVFQRPYSWERVHAKQLFTDIVAAMKRKDASYFFGTLILSHGDNDTGSLNLIVDGQQRMLTLTILLCLLRDFAKSEDLKREIDQSIHHRASAIRRETVDTPRLMLHGSDEKFFKNNIQKSGSAAEIKLESKDLTTVGQRHLYGNLEELRELLRKHLEGKEVDAQGRLTDLVKFLLDNCHMVVLHTMTVTHAIRVFSINNARGLPLNFMDILKAHFISRLSTQSLWEKYAREWESWESKLGRNEYKSLFEKIMLLLQGGKPTSADPLQVFFNLSVDPQMFFDDILEPCSIAADVMLKCTIPPIGQGKFKQETVAECNTLLLFLNASEYQEWQPCVLAYLAHALRPSGTVKFGEHSARGPRPTLEQTRCFLASVEKSIARMMLAKTPSTDTRKSFFNNVLQEMLLPSKGPDWARYTVPEFSPKPNKEQKITQVDPVTTLFDRLNGDIYSVPYDCYMVLRYESLFAEKFPLASVEEWNKATIEHILPQSIKPTNPWFKNHPCWQDRNIRAGVINKLGNLAPLSGPMNTTAGNEYFDKKLEAYKGSKYASLWDLGRKYTVWDMQSFEQRHKEIVTKLAQLWNIPIPTEDSEDEKGEEDAAKEDELKRSPAQRAMSPPTPKAQTSTPTGNSGGNTNKKKKADSPVEAKQKEKGKKHSISETPSLVVAIEK